MSAYHIMQMSLYHTRFPWRPGLLEFRRNGVLRESGRFSSEVGCRPL
jgi:hypothetical protein